MDEPEHKHTWGTPVTITENIQTGVALRQVASIVLICPCGDMWRRELPEISKWEPKKDRR